MAASGKQDRGEPPPPRDRHLVRRAPGLEKLDKLLARAVLVPTAIPTHDFKEVIDRFRTLPAGVERDREIESRLVVEGVGVNALLQLAKIPEGGRLLGKLDRGASAGEQGIVRLGGRRHREEALGALEIAEVDMKLHESGERGRVLRVLAQDRSIELGGAAHI